MFEVISWGYIVTFSHYEHAVVFWNGHRSKMLWPDLSPSQTEHDNSCALQ